MKSGWRRVATALAVTALALAGCTFETGKPLSWRSTIDTEFDLPAHQDHELGAWQFADPFELKPGPISLKYQFKVGKADVASAPTSLTWTLRLYEQNSTTPKAQYQLSAPGKMKPHGSSYLLSYKLKEPDFPGFNAGQLDHLAWSIQPDGGSIRQGTSITGYYVYTPH